MRVDPIIGGMHPVRPPTSTIALSRHCPTVRKGPVKGILGVIRSHLSQTIPSPSPSPGARDHGLRKPSYLPHCCPEPVAP